MRILTRGACPLDSLLTAEEANLVIYLITQGTGASGEQMCRTVAGQFPISKVAVTVMAGVKPERLEAIVSSIAREGNVIAHTLMDDAVRLKLVAAAREHQVPCVDLFSELVAVVSKALAMPPLGHSGVYRQNCAWHAQLSEAIHFAIKHDDGAKPEEWGEADCLIMGVSRAGKSPLSMFLATMGYKVANYPICPGVEIPSCISLIPRGRCFGLIIEPEILAAHRAQRAVSEASRKGYESLQSYTDLQAIFHETEEVEKYFKQKKITRVDVTGQTVQATAKKIIRILSSRYDGDSEDEDGDASTHGRMVRHPRYTSEDFTECDSPPSPASTPKKSQQSLALYVVTTGCGFSAERLVSSVVGQFPKVRINVENRSYCHEEDLPRIVEEVAQQRGMITHTLVVRAMRGALEELCQVHSVPCVDLFGPLLDVVANALGTKPSEQRGAYQCWSAEYFRFVKAVEFALDHDDGAFPSGWRYVDALLLGTSNTGKSALSVFLGTLGKKAANLTLRPNEALPAEFETVDRRRVFGMIRSKRRGAPLEGEAAQVEQRMREMGITIIDCTCKPVEQAANFILKCLDDEFGVKTGKEDTPEIRLPVWAW